MTSTDDRMLLDASRKKERLFKNDERTVSKVEEIQEKIDTLDVKESAELGKIETSKDYFNKEIRQAEVHLEKEMRRIQETHEKKIRQAEEYFESEKRFLRETYDKKIKYYEESLESLEKKEESVREKYDKLREKKSNKVNRLANKVQTTKGKQLLQDVSQNTIVFSEIQTPPQETERQRAIRWLEENGHENYCKTEKLFPNYFKENEEAIKRAEEQRKQSPQYRKMKLEAENAKIAEELERKAKEDKLGEKNRAVEKALKELKEARAKQLSVEEVEKLRIAYEALLTDYQIQSLQYQTGGVC